MHLIKRTFPFVLAFLVLALTLYQTATTYFAGEWRNPSDEMVTKWEGRVQALREALPPGMTVVGYVDDSSFSGESSDFDANEFQLMQYSLAPVALQTGTDHEWLIGNFRSDEDLAARLQEEFGAHEVQGFGFGLYLIHDLEN